ncbi:unnamed protein product [Enterobius vermicularis]|uniref:CUB domain-containing protein n=1 Tax=Enterobius vermicularis TaxID=51028 RepID=A0A0N4VM08_ENTVE|nr:unnamed protein product [Enterobius vermicularis]
MIIIKVRNELIDKNSIQFNFEMVSSGYGSDQLTITTRTGETRTIGFPGCYNIQLSFRLNRPLKNPYVEAFLQLGTNIPCESEASRGVSNFCTNITQSNWCPQSTNEQLRRLLNGKKTCRFCNLCDNIKSKEGDVRKYITSYGSQECRTDKQYQTLNFRKEFRDQNKEHEEKLEEYWNYLKQGVLTAVVHVTDRAVVSESKRSQCERLCSTYSSQRGVSTAYKSTLLKSIENMCNPTDTYVACVYHTMKFDVNGEFA